jgi:restriction endonuclease S subunit
MTLGEICDFKINDETADFWLVRRGGINTVGTPTKTFSPEHIGVKVNRTDLVLPDFLYYYFQYLQVQGLFKQLASGTTNLTQIPIADLKAIKVSFG